MSYPDIDVAGFGLVGFNPVAEWYEFHVAGDRGDVPIAIIPDSDRQIGRGADEAAVIARRLVALINEARRAICDEMLELKNDTWRIGDEAVISADEFMNRLTLESVGVKADGSAEFFFMDGDLFLGHCVIIKRDSEGHFHRAYLFG